MNQHTILVIGATGTVGAPVARQLRDDGYHVRLLVRDPKRAAAQLGSGFDYIQGSVEERETVQQALSGCTGVHLSLQAGSNPADIERVEHLGTLGVIELAAQQHLAHVTYVSGMFACGYCSLNHSRQPCGSTFFIFTGDGFVVFFGACHPSRTAAINA